MTVFRSAKDMHAAISRRSASRVAVPNLRETLLLAAAILAMIVPSANAQVPAPQVFSEMTIVLPLDLVAGEPATIAVLSSDGRVAPGVNLIFSHGEVVTTDESGRAHFLAPLDAGILIARIPGTQTQAAADVVRKIDAASLQIASVPSIAGLKDRFTIHGAGLQGDADRNHVELAGRPAFVLAASPVELVILASSRTAPGKAQLSVKAGSGEVSTRITLVNVVSDSTLEGVRPGKKARVVLHVRGTLQPIGLEVRNLTPGIVQFKHGDYMNVQTQGGMDNSAMIEVKEKRAGEFSYAVALASPPGTANTEAARDFLEAAAKLAASDEKRRIEKVLKKLRRQNPDVRGARKEFAKIPAANSVSDLQALIRAARKALNGR